MVNRILLLAVMAVVVGCSAPRSIRQGVASAATLDCATASAGGVACAALAPRAVDLIPGSVSDPQVRERVDEILTVGCAAGSVGGAGCGGAGLSPAGVASTLFPQWRVETTRTLECLLGEACATAQVPPAYPLHGFLNAEDRITLQMAAEPLRVVIRFRDPDFDPAATADLWPFCRDLKEWFDYEGPAPDGAHRLVTRRNIDLLQRVQLLRDLRARREVESVKGNPF